MKDLMTALCGDVEYQYRLRADFRRRRVHPTIEALVWGHVVGKPTERVQLSADVTMNEKFERERELFLQLPIEQLKELAAESEALLNKAISMARAHGARLDAATAPCAPMVRGDGFDPDLARARTTAVLVAVAPSPAAGGGSTGPSSTRRSSWCALGARLNAAPPRCTPVEHGDGRDAPDPNDTGTAVARTGYADRPLDLDGAQARTAPPLSAVTSSCAPATAEPNALVDTAVETVPANAAPASATAQDVAVDGGVASRS